jgi:hypothetical protein
MRGTGCHCIDTEYMAILHRQREKQKQKELDVVQKKPEIKNKLLSQVRVVVSDEKSPDQLTLDKRKCPRLKVMLMYYRNKDDKALPSRKNELFQRYTDTRHRQSLDEVLSLSNSNKVIGTSNSGINNTDSSSKDKLPFIKKKEHTRSRRNDDNQLRRQQTTSTPPTAAKTHQETAMETIDNESVVKNDDSSEDDNTMVCDSASSSSYDGRFVSALREDDEW